MSALIPPPQTRVIGYAQFGKQRIPVSVDQAWWVYLSRGIEESLGSSSSADSEAALSPYVSARLSSIEDKLASVESRLDAGEGLAMLAAIREEVEEIKSVVVGLSQSYSL